MKDALITFSQKGIFCAKGDFYIDPWQPVERAIVTHAHSDHAKPGHGRYLIHADSEQILRQRLGQNILVETAEYGASFTLNGVKVSLHPAGHILGSAQVRVEHAGEVWCVSGDYKIQPDPIAENFEPVRCHTFVTECTFGLPVYQWPEEGEVMSQIETWWQGNQEEGKVSLISAYALGKAQRLLARLDHSIGRIFCHGAVHVVNEVHQRQNKLEGDFQYLSQGVKKEELTGALVVAPPSAISSSWARKLGPVSIGITSGWMMLRGSKRRQNADRGFILSDHADWTGLNHAIKETGAENIVCIHGYTDTFSEWLNHNGYNAMTEKTLYESGSSVIKQNDQ